MAIRHTVRTPARSRKRRSAILLGAVAPLLLLTACGGSDDVDSRPEADRVAVTDAWVKAAPNEMTAAFGVLTNDGDQQSRIVSASTEVASNVELHEVVEEDGSPVMQEKPGGFVVPADGTLELVPGGEHLMLMGLKQPINAGDTVVIELRFADGSTQTVNALARDFSGNQEEYTE